jgi:hypothetical protein
MWIILLLQGFVVKYSAQVNKVFILGKWDVDHCVSPGTVWYSIILILFKICKYVTEFTDKLKNATLLLSTQDSGQMTRVKL